MGNHQSQNRQQSQQQSTENVAESTVKRKTSAKFTPTAYAPALEKLFRVTVLLFTFTSLINPTFVSSTVSYINVKPSII